MIPGGYKIKVHAGSNLPQKVASGFEKVFEGMTGATYNPIAYLGNQVVNGINHAILCEQVLTTATDDRNIVILILNEKPGDVTGESISIVEINRVLDGSHLMGGINIAPTIEIPAPAMNAYNSRFGGLLGATNVPIALLATQVVNGVAYYFAVESTMVVGPTGDVDVIGSSDKTASVRIVKIFDNYPEIQSRVVLTGSKEEADDDKEEMNGSLVKQTFGYAFTWC